MISHKKIMRAYDAEIARGGSADSVIVRTVRSLLAGVEPTVAAQPATEREALKAALDALMQADAHFAEHSEKCPLLQAAIKSVGALLAAGEPQTQSGAIEAFHKEWGVFGPDGIFARPPKSYITICMDLLAEAISSNTDASLVEARHIINTALKTSDSTVYQGAKRDAQ